VSGTGIRAAEGVASLDQLTELMAVQRAKFSPSRRLEIPDPIRADLTPLVQAEWQRRKAEVHIWQRALRRRLKAEIEVGAAAEIDDQYRLDLEHTADARVRAEAWWQALSRGDEDVMRPWLKSAFEDNPAKVMIYKAEGVTAFLFLQLPGIDVLPAKRVHVTPTGRLSSKAWTKTERNNVYADLCAAHLLATLREAWAVAPSLQSVRVVGLLKGEGHFDVLFDVDADRAGPWHRDDCGSEVLKDPVSGLVRIGRTEEVERWPTDRIDPAVLGLLP